MNRVWNDISLELSDTDRGLRVRQHDEAYIARGWCLTPSVLAVAEMALSHGLGCMIQNRHPQTSKREPMGDGAVYLSFARKSTEHWVLGLNENAGSDSQNRSTIERALFNKNYRHALVQADIPFQVEKFRNASNIEVPIEFLEKALKACLPYLDAHAGQKGKGGIEGEYPGFRDEADIERWLMENLNEATFGRAVSILGRQVRIDVGIVDILARDELSDSIVVIEVKQGRAQPIHVVEQLARYLASKDVARIANGRPIVGLIFAELIESTTKEVIERSASKLLGYTIEWRSSRKILVERVAGKWT